ncbi:MAG: diguanylate cyclase [Chloroflexota bacterium]
MANNSLDPLTGLLNRKAFDETLHATFLEASRDGTPLSLAFFDLDNFLGVNQTFGHPGGDAVLKTVADTVSQVVGGRGQVARYGGDEFAVIFAGLEREQAFLIMEQVRVAVESLSQFSEGETRVETKITITGGVAAHPIDGSDENELIRKADGALYRAKVNGRNKIALAYEERMIPKTAHYTQTQLERLTELASEQGVSEAVLLREALDDLLIKYKHNFLFFDQLKGKTQPA